MFINYIYFSLFILTFAILILAVTYHLCYAISLKYDDSEDMTEYNNLNSIYNMLTKQYIFYDNNAVVINLVVWLLIPMACIFIPSTNYALSFILTYVAALLYYGIMITLKNYLHENRYDKEIVYYSDLFKKKSIQEEKYIPPELE